jgi:hypothetical protein
MHDLGSDCNNIRTMSLLHLISTTTNAPFSAIRYDLGVNATRNFQPLLIKLDQHFKTALQVDKHIRSSRY